MKGRFRLATVKGSVGLLLATLLFAAALSGCSGGDAAENTDNRQPPVSEAVLTPLLEETDQAVQTLTSVGIKTVFVREKTIEGESDRQESWVENTLLYGPEGSIPKMATKMPVGDTIQDRLDIDGQGYLRNAGRSDWVLATSEPPEVASDYFPVYEEFKKIAPKLSMEESETEYLFTFEGTDAELYQTLRDRYKLHIEGAPDEGVQLKLKYVIAKDAKFITEVDNTSEIVSGEDKVHLQTTIQYTAINPAADLQPPAEETIIQL